MRRAVGGVALLLLCGACPRPLGNTSGDASRVPPDASVVLVAPSLRGLQEISSAWLPLLGASGRPLAGLSSALDRLGGPDALTPETASFAGLDPEGEVHISWRPTGDVIVALPVSHPAVASTAMELLLAGESGAPPASRGPTQLFSQGGDVVLAATPAPGALLLAPRPVDVEGSAALLAAMARGDTPPSSLASLPRA